MTATITPRIVRNALRILFERAPCGVPELAELAVLDQRELATHFRARAMEMHPDRASVLGMDPDELNAHFKRLHGAYRVLCRVVEDERLRAGLVRADSGIGARPTAARGGDGLWTPRPPAESSAGRPHAQTRGSHPGSTAEGSDGRRFYSGKVPHSELRFAQFLYYNRVIDWKTMIDAVTWQYRVRPKVGEIGRSYKFIDFKGVADVLRRSPRGELFGDTALRLGKLDIRQLRVVLGKQHQLNYPIGRYFVEHGILSAPEVEHLIAMNRRHNSHVRKQP